MPDRKKKYKVFECYDETLSGVQRGIDNIINDPLNKDYDLDKFEMVYTSSFSDPYRYIVILKLNESACVKKI